MATEAIRLKEQAQEKVIELALKYMQICREQNIMIDSSAPESVIRGLQSNPHEAAMYRANSDILVLYENLQEISDQYNGKLREIYRLGKSYLSIFEQCDDFYKETLLGYIGDTREFRYIKIAQEFSTSKNQ